MGGLEPVAGLDARQEVSVFFKSYIPRMLNEVYDPERDLEAARKGAKTIYSNAIGIFGPKPDIIMFPITTLRCHLVHVEPAIQYINCTRSQYSDRVVLE